MQSDEETPDTQINAEAPADDTADFEPHPGDKRDVEIPGLSREALRKHEGEFPETSVDKVFRLSTFWVGMLILVTVTGTVAWQFWSVAQDVNRSIDELFVYFEEGGLKIEESGPLSNKAGAEWAQRARINGKYVQVYQFAPDTREEQKTRLQAVHEAGAIEVDGKTVPAKVNGAFVLTGFEDNPRKEDILNAFAGFGA